jgi:hypothetical protein
VAAVAPAPPPPRRVAVIAHFFKLAHPDAEGARLRRRAAEDTTLHSQMVEFGGDTWSEVANPYVVALARSHATCCERPPRHWRCRWCCCYVVGCSSLRRVETHHQLLGPQPRTGPTAARACGPLGARL